MKMWNPFVWKIILRISSDNKALNQVWSYKFYILHAHEASPALSLNLLHPAQCSLPRPAFSVSHATVLLSTTINIVVCLQKIHLQTNEKLIQLNAGKYLEKLHVPTCLTLDVTLKVNSTQTDWKNKGKLLAM